MKLKRTIYTSGPIQYAADAFGWRNQMYRELDDSYEVVIPDKFHCPFLNTDPQYAEWIKKHYINPDMADVARCHYFFVQIDHAYSSGTYGELTLASWLNKNIVCFLNGVKKEELPLWIMGCLHDAKFVNSIEEGIEYYKSLIKKENI